MCDNAYTRLQNFDEEKEIVLEYENPKRKYEFVFLYEQHRLLSDLLRIPDHLKIFHPRFYPEQYSQFKKSENFGRKDSNPIVIDGSNIAFAHGAHCTGKYIPNNDYRIVLYKIIT